MTAFGKTACRFTVCAGVCLAAALQPAGARVQIQHWTNGDGAPVYFVHVSELPMVDVRLSFTRSGHAYERKKYGLASMTASMLHQGAAGMDVDRIAETFSGLGARSGAGAGAHSSQTNLRSLTEPQYLEKALEAWIKVFSSPDFPGEQFERRRKNVLTAIEGRRQNPGAVAGKAFREALYGDHPYARPRSGTEESVAALTLGDLRAFHRKHYVISNAIITIVGAISREQAAGIADRITAALETGERAEEIPPVPQLKEALTVRIPFPSEQAHVKIGHPLVNALHPDVYALRLGNDVFGGTGFGSRLFDEIRVKRGFAYSAGSGVSAKVAGGAFTMSFQTRLDQADLAADAARELLREFVASGPTEEEVSLALDRIRGGVVFRTNSNGRILSSVADIAFYERELDYLYDYVAEYEKESRESVTAAFRKHVHPDKMVTVIVGGAAE